MLCVSLVAACGPSVQSIYEGNVRFEHCYRLDLDLNIVPTHREACWKQWLNAYVYGQPRDRIEYARRRLRSFSAGDITRPTLDVSGQRSAAQRDFYLVVPEPTSVRSPPPALAVPVQSAVLAASASAAPAPPAAPGAACSAACESAFRSCQAACDATVSVPNAACKSCEPDYKRCAKRCYE